jgi:N2-acetyl-L-2,4-diaminobutanoate deacetylase
MIPDFDPARPGKAIYDLGPIVGPLEGVSDDILCCINNGEGPSVLLCGGIHGDEYEAQVVLRQLITRLEATAVSGRIFIVPSLNFPAAQNGKRLSPLDGQNMNRVFPGRSDGTPTERLAAFLTGTLFPLVDLLIDVHAGGRDVSVVPMVFGFTTPTSVVNEARLTELMEAWGYRFIQHVTGIRETACGAAEAANLTSVEVEGGGGRMKSAELRTMEKGLLRALAAFGVIAPVLARIPFTGVHFTASPEGHYVASEPGLVEHCVGLGDEVTQDTIVALLHPITGRSSTPRQIRSPVPGYVLRQTEHVFVSPGQLIGNLGTVVRP